MIFSVCRQNNIFPIKLQINIILYLNTETIHVREQDSVYIKESICTIFIANKVARYIPSSLILHNLFVLKHCLFPMEKVGTSKILIIGATGYVGKFMVEASAKAGHPTFALVRESTLSDPSKSSIIQTFNTLGINLLLVRNNLLHAQSLSIFFFCFCSRLLHQVFSPIFFMQST